MIDLSQLEAMQQQMQEARERMRAAAKEIAKQGTEAIFSEYGDIVDSFGWIQYTPYFNDGDPCVFHMHELSIIAKADLENEDDFDEDDLDDLRDEWRHEGSPSFSYYGDNSKISQKYAPDNFDERYEAAKRSIEDIYKVFSMDEGLAQEVFGDDVSVRFKAEGIDVEEYAHD